MKADIQTAIAWVRWPSLWNILRIKARVEGISVAPATPIRARAAISISGLEAYAPSTEAAANPTAPIIRSLRRPIRSPRLPIVIRNPATRKP